jgi:hypothetical protein
MNIPSKKKKREISPVGSAPMVPDPGCEICSVGHLGRDVTNEEEATCRNGDRICLE